MLDYLLCNYSQPESITNLLMRTNARNLDDHMTNFSLLISKSIQVVEKLAMAE